MSTQWLVLVVASLLFGIVHFYQGIPGIISTAILAFVAGLYYMKLGRFWPMVIAHSLYDTAWIIFGIIMMRQ